MPRSFGSRNLGLNPVYWLGHWIGAGAAHLTHEAKYVRNRAKDSSPAELSASLLRSVIASGLIAGEWWVINELGSRRILALAVSLLVLLLLPKPTAKVLLFAGRFTVSATAIASLAAAIEWFGKVFPGDPKAWENVSTIVFWLSAAGLLLWPFSAFRSKARLAASSGVVGGGQSISWSNIPNVDFSDVGGFSRAKTEIRAIAENRLTRNSSGIVRNGILLHGPQGTGKNFLAEATAGEFHVNFYHVRCPELLGTVIGSTTAEIRRVFEWAASNRPIVIFLDEIDSLGSKKAVQGGGDSGGAGREYNTIVTQLMHVIDQHRSIDGLLIMAATNYLESLEPTLIREGRFDARLRLDLPDEDGRKEILAAQLRRNGWRQHDLTVIARRTPGWSPARLKGLVDRAALLARSGAVDGAHLLKALESSGEQDSPAIEKTSWDDVVLPQAVIQDLQALVHLMTPGEAERLSVPSPTGLILIGAPGTGKTLTAKLLASQSRRSFYAISPSDVLSGAMGGSVKRLSEIFARAKEHAPSVLFFDEMDGLFPHVHGPVGHHDVQLVEQALIEISALKAEHNVFLVGTTNYIDRIDPRILRGGRFSEKIEIGVPDDAGYEKLISRYLGKARLASSITLDMLIDRVRGMSPADLEATIHSMKRVAMRRMATEAAELPPLVLEDLDEALARVQPRF
jgi:transitional endoplasmic reticulum ATPase